MSKFEKLTLILLASIVGLLFVIGWILSSWYDTGGMP